MYRQSMEEKNVGIKRERESVGLKCTKCAVKA